MKSLSDYNKLYNSLEEKINSNTEKYRKGNIIISVKNRNGELQKCKIELNQTENEFIFGCNGLLLGSLGDNNDKYEKLFCELFSLVTTTFCWNITETKQGKFRFKEGDEEIFRRPPADRVVNFAKKHGLLLKGQPLLADSWKPEWTSNDPDVFKEQCRSYFKAVSERYADDFYMFDAVNEAFLCKNRTPDHPLFNEQLDYVKWGLDETGNVFKNKVLLERNENTYCNEGEQFSRYYNEAKALIASKTRLDSVGFQFHMFDEKHAREHLKGNHLNLSEIYDNYIKFSDLNIPMFISEVTIPSKYDGLSVEDGLKIQQNILENLYRLWFSIPSMKGIIYWNLVDGTAWQNEGDCLGCLVDSTLKPKPSYNLLKKLIKEDWMTNDSFITNGKLFTRGFNGKYELKITLENGETIENNFLLNQGKDANINITI